jgi:hypothetical protein
MSIRLADLVAEGFAENTHIYQIQQRIYRLQKLIVIERDKLASARQVQQRKRELEKNRQQHQNKSNVRDAD